MHQKATARGWYEWELVSQSGIVLQYGTAHNLVLNKGLDALMTGGGSVFASYIAVGTGSTVPAAAQVGLVNELARTNQTLSIVSGTGVTNLGNGLYRRRFGVAFDYAQANGNLTEFGGSAAASAGSNLNSRALITDGNGNPITITKTSDKRLVIYYNLEIQMAPIVETAGNIMVTGIGNVPVTYMFVTRADGSFGYGDFSLYDSTSVTFPIGFYTSSAPIMAYANSVDKPDAVFGGQDVYAAGTYTRTVTGERAAEAADVTVYGYSITRFQTSLGNANTTPSAKVKFNAPIVKNKDYKLKLSARYSISAA